MKAIKLLLIAVVFLLSFIRVNAQLFSIKPDSSKRISQIQDIEQGLDKADLVVEGKVIKSKGIWNKTYTGIFTSNIVVVYKLFKGTLTSDTIEIVCRGGFLTPADTLADRAWASVIEGNSPLGPDEEGIFFLQVNNWNAQAWQTNSFVLWHDFRLKYLYDYVRINPPVGAKSYMFKSILEVYNALSDIQKKPYTIITENPKDKTLKK